MITRNTWILLGILVVLVGVAVLVPKYLASQPQPTPTAAAPAAKPVFPTGDVSSFSIKSADGKSVAVKSLGNNQWSVTEPTGLEYDATTVQSAAGFFKSAMIQTALETQPAADAMGLASPAVTVTIQMADGSQKVMNVGKATPTGEGYYVQVDTQPAVTVSKSEVESLTGLLTAGKPPVTPTAVLSGTPGLELTPAANPTAQ
jgi:hypothetical protein